MFLGWFWVMGVLVLAAGFPNSSKGSLKWTALVVARVCPSKSKAVWVSFVKKVAYFKKVSYFLWSNSGSSFFLSLFFFCATRMLFFLLNFKSHLQNTRFLCGVCTKVSRNSRSRMEVCLVSRFQVSIPLIKICIKGSKKQGKVIKNSRTIVISLFMQNKTIFPALLFKTLRY